MNTNIPWLPYVADGWQIKKVKYCFSISKDISKKENPTVLTLARAGVRVRDLSNNEGQIAASYDNYNTVLPGDLLLNPMDLYSGANCSLSEVGGVISPAYVNLRAIVPLSPKFFDLYFKTQYWNMAMFAHGKGVSFDNRWTINAEGILNYELPFPSFERQILITDYISRKNEEIENLIAVEETQIEKLKEYRRAIITEAVTKGLDKNVPMKDSGVEWIGEIPESWKIAQTKDLFDIIAGATPDSGEQSFWDGEIKWITPADYKTEDVYVSRGRRNISLDGYNSCSTSLIPAKSIIFSKRAPIGLVAINSDELCTNQGCLSCIKKTELSIKFFYYQMSVKTESYELFASGTTFKEISAQKFGSFRLAVPPTDEQKNISDYLDKKCSAIYSLIKLKQRKIEELNNYKKSLIYECVTGKRR